MPSWPQYLQKLGPQQVPFQLSQGSTQKFKKLTQVKPFQCSQQGTKSTLELMKDSNILALKLPWPLAMLQQNPRLGCKLSQWDKVGFPFIRFYSQKPTSKRKFSNCVSVIIPALTVIVDRQSKEDRILCSVRALRYYLDHTKDLRGFRSLLFISFKKGHSSDIRLATLSSWLKQTTEYPTMLQTSRSTILGPSPS